MTLFRIDDADPTPVPAAVSARPLGDGRFELPGGEHAFAVAHGDTVYVQWQGRAWRVDREDPTVRRAATGAEGAGLCRAPMPGVVVSLLAGAGQAVLKGDPLLVIESMKLQATVTAPHDGVLVELPLDVGQTFQRGALLAHVLGAGA